VGLPACQFSSFLGYDPEFLLVGLKNIGYITSAPVIPFFWEHFVREKVVDKIIRKESWAGVFVLAEHIA
jgi:hypothetical protein